MKELRRRTENPHDHSIRELKDEVMPFLPPRKKHGKGKQKVSLNKP